MTTCAPGTHFHTRGPDQRWRCIYCDATHVPPPPRPRCPRCGGIGITSLTWDGLPGSGRTRWRMDACQACDGTGTPREEERK